jgi:hypothetical protein
LYELSLTLIRPKFVCLLRSFRRLRIRLRLRRLLLEPIGRLRLRLRRLFLGRSAFRLVVLELVALQLDVLLVLGRRRRRVGIGVVSDDEISMREREDCLGVITYLLMYPLFNSRRSSTSKTTPTRCLSVKVAAPAGRGEVGV